MVTLAEIDDPPEPGPGEVMLRPETVAICGSDLHIYKSGLSGGEPLTEPMIPGHEVCAIVEGGDTDVPSGTRVALEPAIPCMRCEFCLRGDPNLCPHHTFLGLPGWPGAMRERFLHPAHLIAAVPDAMTPRTAPLLEPLGVAVHTADLAKVRLGQTVCVIGLGAIGLMVLQIMRRMGCRVIGCDPVHERVVMAERFAPDLLSATRAEDAIGQVLDWTGGRGVDVAIEVAGPNEAVRSAVEMAAPGGRVVVVGIQPDDQVAFRAATARRKGLTIVMVRRSRNTLARAIDLASRGEIAIEPLATHTFPMNQADRAFAHAADHLDGTVRSVIQIGD